MQNYLAKNVATVMRPDELLRAEWVARISALDLYVHELVAQRMLSIFQGALPKTPAYQAFKLPTETMDRIRTAATVGDAGAAFDLEVRRQLGFITYQDPERIAEGLRLCCEIELWNTIALHQGASEFTKNHRAKQMKRTLSAIVERRNKIAHEGDFAANPAVGSLARKSGGLGDRRSVCGRRRPLNRRRGLDLLRRRTATTNDCFFPH